MKVQVQNLSTKSIGSDLLVVPVSKQEVSAKKRVRKTPSGISLVDLEKTFSLDLKRYLKKEGFTGKDLQTSLITLAGRERLRGILLVGWDEEKEESDLDRNERVRKLGNTIYTCAKTHQYQRVSVENRHWDLLEKDLLAALIEGVELSRYSFKRYQKKSKPTASVLSDLTILSRRKMPARVAREARALVDGTALARDLVNMPAKDCTPRYLVSTARKIAQKPNVRLQLYDRNRLKKLGANALLSVAQGSKQPPYLAKLTYRPSRKPKRIISLVGKGITFDTGGYSIKSSVGMYNMKCDMAGAATVLGVMHAVALLRPAVEVRAYVPTCENMINGDATKPGDVVKALNGKTIEILNTDAEGRLILADALCLAMKDGCDVAIDLATLTGSCVAALGGSYAGLFCNDDDLAFELVSQGDISGERLWELPLASEYRDQLNSPIADLKNIGGRYGGAITAALFLQEFVSEEVPWAHLDIAGPAFTEGARGYVSRGGVGFGVRTLTRYLLSY